MADNERLNAIHARMRAFNEKMRELEREGYRSGLYDFKTDETAIVKPGKMPWENEIVGYIDRDLNIRWVK